MQRLAAIPKSKYAARGGLVTSLAETTMSDPRLPAEMLDHIIDHLHDTRDALRNCCLVSKSWIPRTRKYLFADIKFPTAKSMQSWKKTFPNPSISPAYYTTTLSVGCSEVVTDVDADAGGWIGGFSRVVRLELGSQGLFGVSSSLTPFHGFSLIKSLCVTFAVVPLPQIFNLILSFPLIEDLVVFASRGVSTGSAYSSDEPPTAQPSSPPMFTGSLGLYLEAGMEPSAHRLLSLPGGIHFRMLALMWTYEEDLSGIMGLVNGCAHTLEFLDISDLLGTSTRYLRLHRSLTSISRGVEVSFDRPLESDKAQRCGVSA
jgi:hypothetical protein